MDSVAEYIRKEVPDWDDVIIANARFKAFSGQRSDWEQKYFFWRDLIFKVSRHLGLFIISPSEVRSSWFNRGGLTPLCLDNVLLEMYKAGDILRSRDIVCPPGGRLSQLLRNIARLITVPRSLIPQEISNEYLVLLPLLKERADAIVKHLSENHWSSSCIITMKKLEEISGGPNEACAILNYLSECSKASYLSINKTELIEGAKVSLLPAAISSITALDSDVLYLTWTVEKLQQQLDVIDQRCERLRKSALNSLNSGNRKAALRRARELKMSYDSREKCTSLLNRVEEVISVIANAESTKNVSEAIQIGARAIKENGISVEVVQQSLQDIDECIESQKQVEETIEATPLYTGIEDEDIEEELKKLELEHESESPQVLIPKTTATETASSQKVALETAESLSKALSSLELADGVGKQVQTQSSPKSTVINLAESLTPDAA